MAVCYNENCELLLLSRNWNFLRVRVVAKSADWLCHVCPSAYIRAVPAARIYVKFGIGYFYENLSSKSRIG